MEIIRRVLGRFDLCFKPPNMLSASLSIPPLSKHIQYSFPFRRIFSRLWYRQWHHFGLFQFSWHARKFKRQRMLKYRKERIEEVKVGEKGSWAASSVMLDGD